LAAVGVLLSSAEYLAQPWHLRDDGLMSWAVASVRERWLVTSPMRIVLHAVLSYPRVLGMIAVRGVLALLVLLGPSSLSENPWILGALGLTSILVMLRSIYGQDGADHMVVIVYVSLALGTLVGTPTARAAGLWFIALQSCLSYATAGIAKATAEHWRDGTYLVRIMGTQCYGHPQVCDYLNPRPRLARWLARFIIVWESAFPVVLLLPSKLAMAVLIVGALFHLSNAFVMGLNTFFWSFISTYPAILYCVQTRPW
jgi:hypothetical protein